MYSCNETYEKQKYEVTFHHSLIFFTTTCYFDIHKLGFKDNINDLIT